LVAGREDLVAWHYNKNGFFFLSDLLIIYNGHKFSGNLVQEQAIGVGDVAVWRILWNLQVPSKIKIFGW
jgi:hypothetical protein